MTEKETHHSDEDWKARAEAERKKLAEKLGSLSEEERRLPPASFMTLMSTFTTQAMVSLGEMKIPGLEERELDLDGAKFAIDTLAVLKDKTKGNLTPEEERALDDVLQGLRLRYVHKSGAAGK